MPEMDEKDLLIFALVKRLQRASFEQVRLLYHIAGCVISLVNPRKECPPVDFGKKQKEETE